LYYKREVADADVTLIGKMLTFGAAETASFYLHSAKHKLRQ